jgi:hypothetical protein
VKDEDRWGGDTTVEKVKTHEKVISKDEEFKISEVEKEE